MAYHILCVTLEHMSCHTCACNLRLRLDGDQALELRAAITIANTLFETYELVFVDLKQQSFGRHARDSFIDMLTGIKSILEHSRKHVLILRLFCLNRDHLEIGILI